MSRLIILSNRVSLPQAGKCVAGGLAVAMQDSLSQAGGVWMGWNGKKIDNIQDQHFNIIYKSKITYVTVPFTQEQYDGFYCGFSNDTLWPALHSRKDLIEFDERQYLQYQQVNRMFASKLRDIVEPEDIIWVQDYHFFSVARYCRELGMTNKIGFFLHIPFASVDYWKAVPHAKEIVSDLCHYDLIGLQTSRDQKNCMNVCMELLQAQKIQRNLIGINRRIVSIKHYPIGVDVEGIQKALQHTPTQQPQHKVAQKTIIGVDRIDYSKGLFERFNAFADYLHAHPDMQGKVQHQQIACPCRLEVPTYKRLFERFKLKVDLINHELKHEDVLPIDCSYDSQSHEELMALYRHADICWVSSLRDGMNLVAKEYIAAQDPERPGVLILSKYAGAAEEMKEAIIVDPTDRQAMMSALDTALNMPLDERKQRYEQLISRLAAYNIHDWCSHFLSDLECAQFSQRFNYREQLGTVSFYPTYLFRA